MSTPSPPVASSALAPRSLNLFDQPTPTRATDGKNLDGLSDEAWAQLERAAFNFGYQYRPHFVEALTTFVTPSICHPIEWEVVASRFISLAKPGPDCIMDALKAAHADVPEPSCSTVTRKRLSLADSRWNELQRIAHLVGFSSRKAFLEALATDILPHFTDLSSIRDLAVLAVELGAEASNASLSGNSSERLAA